MMSYTPSFGLRSSLNPLPGAIVMHVPSNPLSVLQSPPNSVQLSLSVNNNLANKDSQWLTLEVCREYQRSVCPRSDLDCKYAHPPLFLDTITGGRVMCCYDSIKGKCHRVKPPCKYFHPPQHLKDILIQNGKNNLLIKNMQMNLLQQQLTTMTGGQQSRLGVIPMNHNIKIDNQNVPASESLSLSSPCVRASADHFNMLYNVAKLEATTTTECLAAQYSTSTISTGAQSQLPTRLTAKKRSLAQIYQNCSWPDLLTQEHPGEHVQFKRPLTTESYLEDLLINRDQQINSTAFFANPLGYYLPLNNQATLQSNAVNIPSIISTTPQCTSLVPGRLCSNSSLGVNNLSVIGNLQQQQHLAMVLNAVNNCQGNRSLSDFVNYK